MRRLARTLVIPVVVLSSVPATALANERAGVVTSAEGRVSVARASAPSANPLKFKDEVFLRDRVSTGVDSLARLLLGGKAVITVREHSSVTITEVPGKSIVEVSTGRMALSVARERMKAGESIEVRTPNAVASVRGTVLVTEVSGVGEAVSSAFTVVRGRVDVSQLGPQNLPVGAVVSLGAMQTAGVSSAQGVGAAQPITPQALQRLSADFSVRVIAPPAAVTAGLVSQGQVSHAVTHTSAILQTTEGARSPGVSGRGDSRPGEADKGAERGKSDERGPGPAKLIVAPAAASVVRAGGPTPPSDLSLGRRVNDKIQKDTVPVSQSGNSSGSGAAASSSGGKSGGGGNSGSASSGGSSNSVASNSGGGGNSSAGKSDNAGGSGGSSGTGNDDKASGKSANAKGRVKK